MFEMMIMMLVDEQWMTFRMRVEDRSGEGG